MKRIERIGRERATNKSLPRNAERILFAHRRWNSEEWVAAYWEGMHEHPTAAMLRATGNGRPSSAVDRRQRPSSASSAPGSRLARPSSAPSLRVTAVGEMSERNPRRRSEVHMEWESERNSMQQEMGVP